MKPKTTSLGTTAAATGALFALQHSADAAIIYSGAVDVTASFLAASGTAFANFTFGSELFELRVHKTFIGGGIFGGAYFSGGRSLLINATGGLKKLAGGALISAPQFPGYSSAGGVLRQVLNSNPIRGTWANGQTGFAAFRAANGDLGWFRLVWTDLDSDAYPNTIRLFEAAYNDVPGESIQAGQTSSAPEPSSTALLALAGAGRGAAAAAEVGEGGSSPGGKIRLERRGGIP